MEDEFLNTFHCGFLSLLNACFVTVINIINIKKALILQGFVGKKSLCSEGQLCYNSFDFDRDPVSKGKVLILFR